MALTNPQLTEIRRILGFPDIGVPGAGGTPNQSFASLFSWFRIMEPYGWLETRLQTLSADEEVAIFGQQHTAFAGYIIPSTLNLAISTPSSIAIGAQLQVTVDGSLLVYIAVSGDTPAKVATQQASLITQDPTAGGLVIANTNVGTLQLYARGHGSQGNGCPVLAVSSDPSMQVAIGGSPSSFASGITSGGQDPPGPNFLPRNSSVPVYGYVPIIQMLESDLINARSSLGSTKVDILTRRLSELAERDALLRRFRMELADRLNVKFDPDIAGNRSRGRRRVV